MKRKILILLARSWDCASVPPPRNSGAGSFTTRPTTTTRLLRYYQLQQHLIQLQKSYTQITNQLNLALQMAQFIKNMPARYRALFSQWRNVTSLNTFGNTGSWISGINYRPAAQHQHRLPEVHNPTPPVQLRSTLGDGRL